METIVSTPAGEELDELEVAIVHTLKDYCVRARKLDIRSDRDWTREWKDCLGRLGESRGLKVCTAGFDCYQNEWLFDMIWYREEGEGHSARMVDMPLAIEVEWNRDLGYIKADFEKLLVTNAPHRLFICYAHPDFIPELMNYFREAISKFRQGVIGNRFLIAILRMDTRDMVYTLLVKKE